MAILSTIGLIDTGSITFSRWGLIGSLSCPGGIEGCEKVLNSAWGTIFLNESFAIPLSLVGLISYFTVLILSIIPLLPGLAENKIELSIKTWWSLFFISCCMSFFSVILIGIMVFKINSFCFFCILSAIISFILLGLTIIGGGWEDYNKLLFRGIVIAFVVSIGGLIWASKMDPNRTNIVSYSKGYPPAITTKSNNNQISLAKHLTESGITMYSAYWCPHCNEQKEMFGQEAVSELKIVECAEDGINNQSDLCKQKGIEGYPSWEINNQIESGIKSLEELSRRSNFKN